MPTFPPEPPEPWLSFLRELDSIIPESCKLPCFGGFAVTEVYGISRATSDIDVLDVAPPRVVNFLMERAGRGSELHRCFGVYFDVVGVASAPYEYESRLRPLFQGAFQHLELFVMDPYDVALTKLKRDSDKDVQDVMQLAEAVPFDLVLFEKRFIEELRDNTTGHPEANDEVFYRWKTIIEEDRARRKR